MKNVKLTLATTLSVLALTFAGAASADGGNRYKNQKQQHQHQHQQEFTKSTFKKNVNRNVVKQVNKNRSVKRVVVEKRPSKKVVITKRVVKHPAKDRFVATKRFDQFKKYQQRANNKNRSKRYNKRATAKQYVYSVRPGDTLIQISFKTGVSVYQLARLNRLQHWNYLQVGQRLKLV